MMPYVQLMLRPLRGISHLGVRKNHLRHQSDLHPKRAEERDDDNIIEENEAQTRKRGQPGRNKDTSPPQVSERESYDPDPSSEPAPPPQGEASGGRNSFYTKEEAEELIAQTTREQLETLVRESRKMQKWISERHVRLMNPFYNPNRILFGMKVSNENANLLLPFKRFHFWLCCPCRAKLDLMMGLTDSSKHSESAISSLHANEKNEVKVAEPISCITFLSSFFTLALGSLPHHQSSRPLMDDEAHLRNNDITLPVLALDGTEEEEEQPSLRQEHNERLLTAPRAVFHSGTPVETRMGSHMRQKHTSCAMCGVSQTPCWRRGWEDSYGCQVSALAPLYLSHTVADILQALDFRLL